MTNQNLYLDVNVIQTVPAANINRDDTGSPKTVNYGGVTRARVSSQSWKRAIRKGFETEDISTANLTKKAVELLSNELQKLSPELNDEDAQQKAKEILEAAGIKLDKDNLTKALLFISPGQINKMAEYALNNEELDKKELKKVFKGNQALDLALFGRMVADSPELNVEASAQVAHAFSTHEIIPEFDYFTALDDCQEDDNAGSSMIGTVEFNSSTLYRYANLNINELKHNLGNEYAVKGSLAFIKEFVLTMPTGKQNSYANKTIPNYVVVSIRKDTPVNLASAFETPVRTNGGYVKKSVERLNEEYMETQKFVEEPILTVVLEKGNLSENSSAIGSEADNLDDLISKVSEALTKAVQNEDNND